ncbi:hypothetical protein TNCV_2895361 [Trichonephila clavipes]|nr:hypothetical protein TNCV_2895361 [Trichonephila clavipes]
MLSPKEIGGVWKLEGCHLRPHQGRRYRRMSRINDTGPSSYRGSNMCNYSPTNRVLISKKCPQRNFDTGPPQN